jgi:hypothetical protein
MKATRALYDVFIFCSEVYRLEIKIEIHRKQTRALQNYVFGNAYKLALGPIQPHIQWVPETLSPGENRPGREAERSPPSTAEVKNAWSYTSTHPYTFIA